MNGSLRTVRPDRVFRAGDSPLATGHDCWWIVDWKTAQADEGSQRASLEALRAAFAPQLEAYAVFLRRIHGENVPVRAGLYYPRMKTLDWWRIEP